MEGFNISLNFHVITQNPSIYDLILNLKTIEMQISSYYMNRTYNKLPRKEKRKQIDIDRDIKIQQLKSNLNDKKINLESFMLSTTKEQRLNASTILVRIK